MFLFSSEPYLQNIVERIKSAGVFQFPIGRPSNEENFMSLVLTANSFSIINEDDNGVTIILETEREPYKFVGSLHEPPNLLPLFTINKDSLPERRNLEPNEK